MEAVRIIKEMREATDGKYPTFALWENVPGAFSSNGGEDFRTVLEELIKIAEPGAKVPPAEKGRWPYADVYVGEGWSLAYRTLDSQYWGVPQRRRRIYLIADFRGERAGKILFEREGLRGHTSESGEARKDAPNHAEDSTGTADNSQSYGVTTKGNGDAFCSEERHTAGCNGKGWKEDICYTLNTIDRPAVCLETFHLTTEEEKAQPLKARDYKDPLTVCLGLDRAAFNQGENAKYDFTITDDQSSTLVARGPNAVCYWNGEDVSGTLTAHNAAGSQRMPDKENFNCVIEEKPSQYIVRRLTPTECCRLQGFPDGWGTPDHKEDLTDEEYKFWYEVRNTHAAINGKKQQAYTKPQMLKWYNSLHTDSAEYKMWGNGIALPTALYVMQGIAENAQKEETP